MAAIVGVVTRDDGTLTLEQYQDLPAGAAAPVSALEVQAERGDAWSICSELVSEFPLFFGEQLLYSDVLKSVFGAVNHATYAVVEFDYIDLDQRSEIEILTRHQFKTTPTSTVRFHFFDEPPDDNSTTFTSRLESLASESYRGYLTLRSARHAPVGRTMVKPPFDVRRAAESGQSKNNVYVRTPVAEYISLFGVAFRAEAVPFMQYDEAITVCAHVTAWMAYQTNVLRGLAPRRSIGSFYSQGASGGDGTSKGMFAGGLSVLQIGGMLREMGASVRSFDAIEMLQVLGPTVFERTAKRRVRRLQSIVSESYPEWEIGDDPLLEVTRGSVPRSFLNRFWMEENITSTICRYLNSGFPVIWHSLTHSILICGYKRIRDYGQSGSSSVGVFIGHDGAHSGGPYREYGLDQLRLSMEEGGFFQVITPEGLWMRATDAEHMAAKEWQVQLDAASRRADDDAAAAEGASAVIAQRDRLRSVKAACSANNEPGLTLRTYGVASLDFVRGFVERASIFEHFDSSLQAIRLHRLPRYVWVTEILDRKRRDSDLPAVIGEVVQDASAMPISATGLTPLLTHLPGVVLLGGGGDKLVVELAVADSLGYESGRWHTRKGWQASAETIVHRYKSTVIS